jgi:ATP-dependent RNA helicase RhlB
LEPIEKLLDMKLACTMPEEHLLQEAPAAAPKSKAPAKKKASAKPKAPKSEAPAAAPKSEAPASDQPDQGDA